MLRVAFWQCFLLKAFPNKDIPRATSIRQIIGYTILRGFAEMSDVDKRWRELLFNGLSTGGITQMQSSQKFFNFPGPAGKGSFQGEIVLKVCGSYFDIKSSPFLTYFVHQFIFPGIIQRRKIINVKRIECTM